MLIARDDRGEPFSLLPPYEKPFLEEIRETHSFFCPVCHGPLIMKLGEKKCFHFAHRKDAVCHVFSEPETAVHIQGKKDLFAWLQSQNRHPHLEQYLSSINQRADVWIENYPHNLAFEFQCSTLPVDLLMKRDHSYRLDSNQPIWIWNTKRLKSLGPHLFHLRPLEWTTRRFPFAQPPHTFPQRQKGFLLFYSPDTQSLTFLYHLIPLNTRKVWAESRTIPLQSLTLQEVLFPSLVTIAPLEWKSAWLSLKKKWRTASIPRTRPFERYLQQVAASKHLVWQAFPGIVGLPLGDDGMVETDVHLWQGWVCLTFLLGKKRGSTIFWEQVLSHMKPLTQKKWVVERKKCDERGGLCELLHAYLKCLCIFGYIEEKRDQREYIVKEPIVWPEPFLQELLKEDRDVLDQWLNPEQNMYGIF